jgi:molybdopterin molybdotransferase
MDGYAVRGDDVEGASPAHPVLLTVTGRIAAGEPPSISVETGEAVRIMTGAPVPEGADSVVRVEDTDAESEPGTVRILGDRDRGRNIRPAGEDMAVGDLVLRSGESIHPGTVGVLYALGKDHVLCARRPVVAIVSTGDELRSPDRYDEVRAGAGVPESNGPMLAAAVTDAGCVPMYVGVAADDPADIRRHLDAAAAADVIITVGGASMGEADLVKRVLEDMSFELDFWRARVRPGSPISFGLLPRDGSGAQPVFGLPGNPASSFVTFEIFVRPFIRRLAGHDNIHRPVTRCVAGDALSAPKGLLYALRVRVDAATSPPTAHATGPQGSGLVQSMSAADGLALIPEDHDGAMVGQEVDVMLLGSGLHATAAHRSLSRS